MNAPLSHPVKPDRFPRLSPAQKLLQAAADRALMAPIIAELGRPRPIIDFGLQDRTHPTGLEWGTARESRNVLR